jgi:hypothetical protein
VKIYTRYGTVPNEFNSLKYTAEAFLEGDDGITIDMKKKHIKLSKILGWYQEDFGKNKDEVTVQQLKFMINISAQIHNTNSTQITQIYHTKLDKAMPKIHTPQHD